MPFDKSVSASLDTVMFRRLVRLYKKVQRVEVNVLYHQLRKFGNVFIFLMYYLINFSHQGCFSDFGAKKSAFFPNLLKVGTGRTHFPPLRVGI